MNEVLRRWRRPGAAVGPLVYALVALLAARQTLATWWPAQAVFGVLVWRACAARYRRLNLPAAGGMLLAAGVLLATTAWLTRQDPGLAQTLGMLAGLVATAVGVSVGALVYRRRHPRQQQPADLATSGSLVLLLLAGVVLLPVVLLLGLEVMQLGVFGRTLAVLGLLVLTLAAVVHQPLDPAPADTAAQRLHYSVDFVLLILWMLLLLRAWSAMT